MFEITEIRPLKSGLFSLYLNGEYAGKLDEETLYHAGLKVGAEITEETLGELLRKAGKRIAVEKALRLVTFRDRSKAELADRLRQDFDDEAAEEAAERMVQLGLVDDAEYARRLARELIGRKYYGEARARLEMRRRGLEDAAIEAALGDSKDDAGEQALTLLHKKYPRGVADERDRRRASALLQRYGYHWDDIREALARFQTEEQDADTAD